MNPEIQSEFDQLNERLNFVRYFYALGFGGYKKRAVMFDVPDRVAQIREMLEVLAKDETFANDTPAEQRRKVHVVDERVCGIERLTISEQYVELTNQLEAFTPDELHELGLVHEAEHVRWLISQSALPTINPNDLRFRLALLRHADRLSQSIRASVRLQTIPSCTQIEFAGVRKTTGAELYFLELRLDSIRARLITSFAAHNETESKKIQAWQKQFNDIWYLDEPDGKAKEWWMKKLKALDKYEDESRTVEQTRRAYEQERVQVMTRAREIIIDGGKEMKVDREAREEIIELACRFLRPVESERLNRVDCAVWTKLVTVLEEINKDNLSGQAAHTSEVATTSVHQPIARVPGVGVEVISDDRRRPWEL